MQSLTSTVNHWMKKAIGVGNTAEDLWNAACEYFMWCEANPIYTTEVIRQTGAKVNNDTPRPFNLPALCIHLGVSPAYILSTAVNKDAGDYQFVCERILLVIESQKYEYAVVGIFNPVLIGKDLKLGDSDAGVKVPAVINITVEKNETPLISSESGVEL